MPQAVATIKAPLEFVFAAFADFPNSARILHSAAETEFLTEHTTGLGTEWIQTVVDDEKPTTARHKITEFTPPRRYVMTSDDSAALETMAFDFTQTDEGVLVSFRVDAQGKGFFKKLLVKIAGPAIEEYMNQDLARMKEAIEESHLAAQGF